MIISNRVLTGIVTIGLVFGTLLAAPPSTDALFAGQPDNDFGAPEETPSAPSLAAPAGGETDALQWHYQTPIPEAVSRVAGVFDGDGNFHAVCGNCNAHVSHPYDEIWKPLTGSWSRGLTHPSGSYGVHNHDVARVDNVIFVGGGSQGSSGYYNRLTAIDLQMNAWTVRASMPINSFIYYAFAAAGGYVYSFGGYNQVGVLRTVFRYDPIANAWSPRASMPEARRSAAVAVVGDTIHVFGGMSRTDIGSTTNSHWKYCWTSNTWTTGVPMPADFGWGRAVVVASPDSGPMVYVIGGVSGGMAVNRVLRYSVRTDAWNDETPLLAATRSPAAGADASRILVVGGYRNGILSTVQEALLNVLDAQAVSIVAPTGAVQVGSVIDPEARIRNNSSSAQTFDVHFTISDGYSDAQTVTLGSGEEQQVVFSSWTASNLGTWGTRCTTLLPGDANPANDQVRDTVSVRSEVHDIQVVTIDAPSGSVARGETIPPQAVLKNNGSTPETFWTRFEIAGGYRDSQSVNLPAGAQQPVVFADWIAGPGGWLATRCTALVADDNPGNNLVADSVFVQAPDVGTEAINEPDWSVVDSGAAVMPQATVRNYGSTTASFDALFTIGIWYSDRQPVTGLNPGESRMVSFAAWTPDQRGRFTTKCTTELADDANPANDMKHDSVDVRVLDVAATAINAPTDTVDSGVVIAPQATVENYGTHSASFEATFTIGTTYSSTKIVASLASGESRAVDFDPWTASELGTLDTRCSTRLSGDQVPGNDLQTGWVAVRPGAGGGDVGTLFISAPSGAYDSAQTETPQATVHNYGTGSSSFQVRFTIGTLYSSTKPVNDLAPGDDEVVDFDLWTARERGDLSVRCTTMLFGDFDNSNDLQQGTVTVNVHDMAAVSVAQPRGNVPVGIITPQGRFHNSGTLRDTVTVVFEIPEDAYQSIRDFPDGLPVGRDTVIDFDDWNAVNPGPYTSYCSTWTARDQFRFNDAFTGHFSVGMSDVGVTQVVAPGGAIETSAVVTPSAVVHNYGALPATFQVFCRMQDETDPVVFLDTFQVSNLPGDSDLTVTFRTWDKPHPEGDYLTRCSTAMNGDAVLDNDTLSRTFSIVATPPIPVWTPLAPMPTDAKLKNVKDGGALTSGREGPENDTTYVYAFKGNNRYEFYRYNTLSDAWVTRESIPAYNRNTKKKAVKKGSSLAMAGDGKLYATKGNNTLDWWQFDPLTQVWAQKTDVPTGAKNCKEGVGSAAVQEGEDSYVYLLRGSGTFDFYRYNTGTDAWDISLPTAPGGLKGKPYKNGSSIAYDGGDTIYCMKGSYNEFAAYSISGRTWSTKDPLPLVAPPGTKKKKVKDGSGMVYAGNIVYVLKGGNTNEFWTWRTEAQAWFTADEMPELLKKVKGGGTLKYSADEGMLYALRGNNTLEFWRYGRVPSFDAQFGAPSAPKGIQGKSSFVIRHSSLSVTPNPFTSSLNPSVSYSVPVAGNVSLKLYDISGKLVCTLARGYRPAGSYSYSLLTARYALACGVYLLRLEAGSETAVSKLVIE